MSVSAVVERKSRQVEAPSGSGARVATMLVSAVVERKSRQVEAPWGSEPEARDHVGFRGCRAEVSTNACIEQSFAITLLLFPEESSPEFAVTPPN